MRLHRPAGRFARRGSAAWHAALAVATLAAAVAGFAMSALPPGEARDAPSVWHGSPGLAALLAACLWPALRQPPGRPLGVSRPASRAARAMRHALCSACSPWRWVACC